MSLTASPVKATALQHGLPVLQPQDLAAPEFLSDLKSYDAELFLVVAFRILPPAVFTLPSHGTINLHASLLPKYRGAAPINWVLLNGESETGVTTFFIEEKVDTGKMQEAIPIPEHMVAGELAEALAELGADLIVKTVDGIEKGELVPHSQSGIVSSAPKISKEMGCLDWSQPTRKVYNQFRGLSPVPGVYSFLQDRLYKIPMMRPDAQSIPAETQPGQVIHIQPGHSFAVATADGSMQILQIQPEGRRSMSAAEFLRGYSLALGDLFEQTLV